MNMHDNVGHVYVMINPSMEGVVKIGRTAKNAYIRARDLRTTGVPKKFVVLWTEFVRASDEVEKKLHTLFANHRSDSHREFFDVKPRDAIAALIEVAAPYRFTIDEKSPRLSIFQRLQGKYETLLRKDIFDVKIAQDKYGVYLETFRRPYKDPKRDVVEYINLDVVANLFSERADVSMNADVFMDLDEYALVNVTDLIEESAARAIWEKHSDQTVKRNT